jgi:hypothetical protein
MSILFINIFYFTIKICLYLLIIKLILTNIKKQNMHYKNLNTRFYIFIVVL